MDGDDRCVTECRPFVVGVPLNSSIALDPDPSLLQLDLPDPEQDDISTMEFLARLEQAWAVCDRFDLQTEIWRGQDRVPPVGKPARQHPTRLLW